MSLAEITFPPPTNAGAGIAFWPVRLSFFFIDHAVVSLGGGLMARFTAKRESAVDGDMALFEKFTDNLLSKPYIVIFYLS